MLSADEVERSLVGSIRLLNTEPDAIQDFKVSIDAFWRSFGAVVLTAPAIVTALAADRVRTGLPLEEASSRTRISSPCASVCAGSPGSPFRY